MGTTCFDVNLLKLVVICALYAGKYIVIILCLVLGELPISLIYPVYIDAKLLFIENIVNIFIIILLIINKDIIMYIPNGANKIMLLVFIYSFKKLNGCKINVNRVINKMLFIIDFIIYRKLFLLLSLVKVILWFKFFRLK